MKKVIKWIEKGKIKYEADNFLSGLMKCLNSTLHRESKALAFYFARFHKYDLIHNTLTLTEERKWARLIGDAAQERGKIPKANELFNWLKEKFELPESFEFEEQKDKEMKKAYHKNLLNKFNQRSNERQFGVNLGTGQASELELKRLVKKRRHNRKRNIAINSVKDKNVDTIKADMLKKLNSLQPVEILTVKNCKSFRDKLLEIIYPIRFTKAENIIKLCMKKFCNALYIESSKKDRAFVLKKAKRFMVADYDKMLANCYTGMVTSCEHFPFLKTMVTELEKRRETLRMESKTLRLDRFHESFQNYCEDLRTRLTNLKLRDESKEESFRSLIDGRIRDLDVGLANLRAYSPTHIYDLMYDKYSTPKEVKAEIENLVREANGAWMGFCITWSDDEKALEKAQEPMLDVYRSFMAVMLKDDFAWKETITAVSKHFGLKTY